MAEQLKYGSIKRFGARYGRTVKARFGKVELEQRRKHKCPYCNNLTVKRVANGIWKCRKCGVKFTGKAYSIKERVTFKQESPKEAEKEGVKNG